MEKGWKLYEKVIIVEKPDTYNNIVQGYIVEKGNSKQLQSAVNWALYGKRDLDRDEYIKNNTVELNNKDFELELYKGPTGSYQGGKLSFANCIIRHGEKEWVIGINTQCLIELIKQSTFINGKCNEKLCFARCEGNVTMLHEDMQEYKDAIAYENKRKNINKGKTRKWEFGKTYDTLKESTLYLGKVNCILGYSTDYKSVKYNGYTYNACTYEIYKKSEVRHLCLSMNTVRNLLDIADDCTSIKLSEFVKIIKQKHKELSKKLLDAYKDNDKINKRNSYVLSCLEGLFESKYNNGITARQPGNFHIEVDMDQTEALEQIYKCLTQFYKKHKEFVSFRHLELFGIRVKDSDKITKSDNEIIQELVNYIKMPSKVIVNIK